MVSRQTSRPHYQGYLWAAASIVLVSVAQLLMKWGMGQLPQLSLAEVPRVLAALQAHPAPLLCVAAGVVCYALSLACWMGVLHFLPLHHAYSLLSLSYALVCLAAVTLPWFSETLTLAKISGIALILVGVHLIHAAPAQREQA